METLVCCTLYRGDTAGIETGDDINQVLGSVWLTLADNMTMPNLVDSGLGGNES